MHCLSMHSTTSDLEAFQNHILMYAGKRFAYSPPVYEARTLLAAIDYNHHNNRPAARDSKGNKMWVMSWMLQVTTQELWFLSPQYMMHV